jgi:hypothetical protein
MTLALGSVLLSLLNLASNLDQQRKFAEAEPLLKRALNAYRQLSEIVKEPVGVDCATAQAESYNRSFSIDKSIWLI